MQYELTPPDRDHEGKMARADLFKLAQYSFKLFKMMEDEQQLDGWVQAKITKAADYIASVYHYLEYEMKFSDYGQRLENSDVYTESIRDVYASKLMEAKKKMDKLKAAMEKKDRVEEGFADLDKYMKDKEKSKGTGKFDKKKISTGTVYTKKSEKDIDDEEDTPKSKKVKESFPTVADAKARHEKEKGTGKFDKKKISTGTVYTRKADKDIDDEEDTPKKNKKVKEGAKPDFLDMDKDGNKKEPMKKAVADKKKKPFAKKVEEDTRVAMRRGPGADMIRYEKDSPAPGAKKHRDDTAKAVKDLRASGQKLKKDDEKKVGDKTVDRYSRDDVSEGTGKCNESAKGKMCPVHGMKECAGMYEGKGKPDFLDIDKDGNKKEPMKKAAKDAKVKEGAIDDLAFGAGKLAGKVQKGATDAMGKLRQGVSDISSNFQSGRGAGMSDLPQGQSGQPDPKAKTMPPMKSAPGATGPGVQKPQLNKPNPGISTPPGPNKDLSKKLMPAPSAKPQSGQFKESTPNVTPWKNSAKSESVGLEPVVVAESAEMLRIRTLTKRLLG
jgi:hypothetical protein